MAPCVEGHINTGIRQQHTEFQSDMASRFRSIQKVLHDLDYFEFGEHFMCSDHDFQRIVRHYKAAIQGDDEPFAWADLYACLASHAHISFDEISLHKTCPQLMTNVIYGIRCTEKASRLFTQQ